MRDLKPVTATNMLECLRPHKKFPQAAEIIRQRLPDCVKDGVSSEYKARNIFLDSGGECTQLVLPYYTMSCTYDTAASGDSTSLYSLLNSLYKKICYNP